MTAIHLIATLAALLFSYAALRFVGIIFWGKTEAQFLSGGWLGAMIYEHDLRGLFQ